MSVSPRTKLLAISFALIFGALLLGAQPDDSHPAATATESDIVVLPKYEITTDRLLPPIEKWYFVSVPGFEILSNAPKHSTEEFVCDFYLLQQVAQILLPNIKATVDIPSYIILCGDRVSFDKFLPKGERNETDPVTGRFLSDGERSAMVAYFGTDPVTPDFNVLSSDSAPPQPSTGNAAFQNFYLQYFRYLIRHNLKTPPPFWLEEGLVQLFAATDFSTRRISFGKVGGGNDSVDVKDGSFNDFFQNRALIGLRDFFSASATDPVEKRSVGYGTQAYLFTHMCLYGRNNRYTKSFFRLAQMASEQPVTEAVFKECFGMSFSKMEDELRAYLNYTDYKSVMMKAKKKEQGLAEAPPFTLRDASDSESSRIVGEVMRLSGSNVDALNRLVAPYVRGHYDADLLAALGIAELEAGHIERVRKFLEVAVRDKTTRNRAYLELAKLRAVEINARTARENRALTQAEVSFIQEPLFAGLKHPPVSPALGAMLARTWLSSPTGPTKEQFEELAALGRTYCTDLGLVFHVAQLGLKCGHIETSRQFIVFGIANSPDESTKYKFEQLSHELPPAKEERVPKK